MHAAQCQQRPVALPAPLDLVDVDRLVEALGEKRADALRVACDPRQNQLRETDNQRRADNGRGDQRLDSEAHMSRAAAPWRHGDGAKG